MPIFEGTLGTSFQMMGNLSISMRLRGYPNVDNTNTFFQLMKGRMFRLLMEEVDDEGNPVIEGMGNHGQLPA